MEANLEPTQFLATAGVSYPPIIYNCKYVACPKSFYSRKDRKKHHVRTHGQLTTTQRSQVTAENRTLPAPVPDVASRMTDNSDGQAVSLLAGTGCSNLLGLWTSPGRKRVRWKDDFTEKDDDLVKHLLPFDGISIDLESEISIIPLQACRRARSLPCHNLAEEYPPPTFTSGDYLPAHSSPSQLRSSRTWARSLALLPRWHGFSEHPKPPPGIAVHS